MYTYLYFEASNKLECTVSPCTACNSVPKKTHLVQNYTVQGLCLLLSDPKISTLCKDHTNKTTLCKVSVLD